MNDTPRTNVVAKYHGPTVDLCRQLERELAQARSEYQWAMQRAAPTEPVGLVVALRCLANGYPEDIFPPLTDQEREQHGALISRAAAAQARHMAQLLTKAADMIDGLTRQR